MTWSADRFLLCTWFRPTHELGNRPLHSQAHKIRGGSAGLYISTFLSETGLRFDGILTNVPSRLRPPQTGSNWDTQDSRRAVVWIPTRPPLDDSNSQRRIIDRSEDEFERRILRSSRPYFDTCSRTKVVLSERIDLSHPADAYRACQFQEFKGGVLTNHGVGETRLYPASEHRIAVGYLIALAPKDGLGRLIAAFGSGGMETLVFTQLLVTELRTRTLEIVKCEEPRLLLVKFSMPEYVPMPLLAYPPYEINARVLADSRLS
jgi:hypothetical protein